MGKKSSSAMMIISSAVCLLPVIPALMIYNDLPERMVMQWSLDGNPNWYAHKAVAAFGLPLFFLLVNISVRIVLNIDPKRENHEKTMRIFAEWLLPFLSLTIVPILLYGAMGAKIPLKMIMVFVGLVFIFFGNYMNKNRQNYCIGIRVPWTLNDSNNWNKTHRMAGFLWILGGMIFMIISFLPLNNSLMLVLILSTVALLAIAPILYSYFLYRKNKRLIG